MKMVLLLFLTAASLGAAEKGWRKRWRKWHQSLELPASGSRCCAVRSGSCQSPAACCHRANMWSLMEQSLYDGVGLTNDSCATQPSRVQCEASVPSHPSPSREVCVWVGGQCVSGSIDDCADQWSREDWYGELSGFERECSGSACPGYIQAFVKYAEAHDAAIRK